MSDYVQDALEDALSKNEKGETTKKILDSGSRRQFESGAVRDIQEGKGRCDLLPLNEVGNYLAFLLGENTCKTDRKNICDILYCINDFIRTGDLSRIYHAIHMFNEIRGWTTMETILEVSKHFEAGAQKYAERNWEQGIPCHSFVDSGIRHLVKWADGMEDEPHDRAFVWNMLCLLWTIKNRPECNDLPYTASDTEKTAEIINDDGSITKECQRCGRYFKTMHRSNKFCSLCQTIVDGGPD